MLYAKDVEIEVDPELPKEFVKETIKGYQAEIKELQDRIKYLKSLTK